MRLDEYVIYCCDCSFVNHCQPFWTGFRYLSRSQQFKTSDFDGFDYIFAMDQSNLSNLQLLQRDTSTCKARVMLFGEYSGTSKVEIVNDPYYGGGAGFKKAYEQCKRFSQNFLDEVLG